MSDILFEPTPVFYTEADYRNVLLQLLPQGRLWNKEPGSPLYRAIDTLIPSVVKASASATNLIADAFVGSTVNLLPEWMQTLGLPDACSVLAGLTLTQQQQQVLARFIGTGGGSKAFIIGYAAALGYDITIQEYTTFRAGTGKAGQLIGNESINFAWTANLPNQAIQYFKAGSSTAGTALATILSPIIECELNRVAPSHTSPFFSSLNAMTNPVIPTLPTPTTPTPTIPTPTTPTPTTPTPTIPTPTVPTPTSPTPTVPTVIISGPVRSLTVTATTSSTLSLSWTAPAVVQTGTTYTVNYATVGGTPNPAYAPITGLSSTTITLTGLLAGRNYNVGVAAVDTAGASTSVSVLTATNTVVVPTPTVPTPSFTESASGTTLTQVGVGSITDMTGEVFTLVSVVGSGLGTQIAVNGTADPTTNNLTQAVYANHFVYQQNTAGNWYSKASASGSWAQTSSPFGRAWQLNPAMDDSFWVRPFQTTSQWTTSGAAITELRNGSFGSPTGHVHLVGDYCVPWYIGTANDPIVTITNGTKSFQVHVPLDAVTEAPYNVASDSSIGGCDTTQPYLIWNCSGASINTGSVQATGTVIHANYGLRIDDGSGIMMMDAVYGGDGQNNSFGASILDHELTSARNDSNYVIQHMLAYALDPSQVNNQKAWPLNVVDTSFPNTGGLAQGSTIGIPASTSRPTGKTRGWYLLFDLAQQFGLFFFNVSGNGCASIGCYSTDPANATLAQDVADSFSDVMQYMCILSNQTGLSTMKGGPGGQNAFPAPPPLDLSPTGGKNILPSTFGAWYPSGYNVVPTNTTTVVPPTVPTPTVPTPTGGESPNNTTVTSVGPSIIDGSGNVWTITSGAQVALNGTAQGITNSVIELAYVNHVFWQENTVGNWYSWDNGTSSYSAPTTTSPLTTQTPTPTTTGSGLFKMVNGQIIDPNGAVFIARGINVYEDSQGAVSTSSACTPLLTLFPHCNFVRLACFNYNTPSYYQTFISQLTAKGIVVELEHHSGAGGGVAPLSGSDLTAENNWFKALAAAFKANPYVWFGTLNEPGPPGDVLTAEQVSNYNTIRGQSNSSPIMMEPLGDYNTGILTIGAGHGLTASSYANMTNIIWDCHFYNGLPDFNASNGTNSYSTDQTFENNLAKTYNQQAQTIRSADGLVPVIIGEYGIATDGENEDPGGTVACIAVQASGVGCAAWNWYSFASSDNLTDNNNNLTSYGQQVAGWMATQSGVTVPTVSPPTVPTPTVGIITPTSGGSVTDAAGNVWTLDTASELVENGATVDGGQGTNGLTVVSGVIWARDASTGTWYSYENGVFVQQAGNPPNSTPVPPTPTPTTPTPSVPTPTVPTPTGTPITAPLTGTVTTGTWVTGQSLNVAAMPNGFIYYAYLLPMNYSTSATYPILVYGHENDEGHDGGTYPSSSYGPQGWIGQGITPDNTFNTVAFRTAHPCIVIIPYCDQTDGTGGTGENWGGYADTPNSQGNELGVTALVQHFIATFSVDRTRIYATGDSLGGIASLAWLCDNNRINGSTKLWTAAWGNADQMYRPSIGQPNTTLFSRMATVPYLAVSQTSDGNYDTYDRPAWQYYTANSTYPSQAQYEASEMTPLKAGNTNFYYLNYLGNQNSWDYCRRMNADGGHGTAMYAWLFSQSS